MTTYRRHVIVKIPSDIAAASHPAILAKAAELNRMFEADRYTAKKTAVEDAAWAIHHHAQGFGACIHARAEKN